MYVKNMPNENFVWVQQKKHAIFQGKFSKYFWLEHIKLYGTVIICILDNASILRKSKWLLLRTQCTNSIMLIKNIVIPYFNRSLNSERFSVELRMGVQMFSIELKIYHAFLNVLIFSLSASALEDDVITCLNKNLITHFFYISRRKKDMTLKHCS